MATSYVIQVVVPDSEQPSVATLSTLKTNHSANLSTLGFTTNCIVKSVQRRDFTAPPKISGATVDQVSNVTI